MAEKKKILELVERWTDFEDNYPKGSLNDFFRYSLLEKEESGRIHNNAKKHPQIKPERPINGRMSKLLGRLYRFSSIYTKKVLHPLPISNMDNFMYLASIRELGKPKKSELILYCQSEFTSGIAIIQRMIKKGWVVEFTDEHDARSKRVSLTNEGTAVLQESFEPMSKAGKIIFHGFSHDEMLVFIQMASRLDRFHSALIPHTKQKSMDEIVDLAENFPHQS